MMSALAFSDRERKAKGIAMALTMPLTTYEIPYPQMSTDRPSAGWETTPPAEPIRA